MSQKRGTRQRAQERRSQRRRRSTINTVIWVSVAAVVLAGVLILISLPGGLVGGSSATATPNAAYAGLQQAVDTSEAAPGFAIGSPDAPVTLVEYSDFSCSHCAALTPTIEKLIQDYGSTGKLRVVYKPVTIVGQAATEPAVRGMICASAQGKAWEMHDGLWGLYNSGKSYSEATIRQVSQSIGLDNTQFDDCFNSQSTTDSMAAINTEASQKQVVGTPTLFMNGQQLQPMQPDALYTAVSQAVQSAGGQ